MSKPTILLVCVHNAGRSQIAAGFLRQPAADSVTVLSAGCEPAHELNPMAVATMAEVGVDVTGSVPMLLEYDTAYAADVIITMACGDVCPVFPGRRYEDWKLDDPAGQPIEVVRRIRDEIHQRVVQLVPSLASR